jgi:dTDP-4-dehydrorhamnose 3,5-epimerase
VLWNDADLAIDWSLVDGQEPTLSGKDAEAPSFKDAEKFT